MIFWNIPSVGQLKPERIFGEDDHFGFIQTLIGEKYNTSEVNRKCCEYYQKENSKYWGQIITLVNAMGMKQLGRDNTFLAIPLLNQIADHYDAKNEEPAKALFDYLLCQWQYPHPILTSNRSVEHKELGLEVTYPRTSFESVKPYQIILAILNHLYSLDQQSAYLKNDEFYWLGYSYYKNQGKGF